MFAETETIAAIGTAPGEGGLAVVRVSGLDSLRIADAVFRGSGPLPSQRDGGTFVHGYVRGGGEAVSGGDGDVDEVVLLVYRAPHSYTREDVVEFQGHGGRTCAQRILRAVLGAGARMAEPGEFTKRAFLSGRIDLVQAEAVLDLVRARSDRAAAAAIEQLEGVLSREIGACYDTVLSIAADLEASLDFDERDVPREVLDSVPDRLARERESLQRLGETWGEGRLLREGALAVIAGRPNVGKSTLLNRLLGMDRAIVTSTPGTTRDTIEEQLVLAGIPLRLVDTAGLRDAECHAEREGVERAVASVRQADVVLYVIDASDPLGAEDRTALDGADPGRYLVILNKTDLGQLVQADQLPELTSVPCSLLTCDDLDLLQAAIMERLALHPSPLPHAVISERHFQLIQYALNELNECIRMLAGDGLGDTVLVASHVRASLEALGRITGRVYSAELLDSIFSKFCIGK